jgi:hypothetical protein
MEAFTYSSARQNLARLLDLAAKKGEVRILRRDGTSFVIRPEGPRAKKSPLDVKGVDVKGLVMSDLLESIHEGRKQY